MILTYHCPRCGEAQRVSPAGEAPQLECSSCHWTKPLPAECAQPKFAPTACLCCGNSDLWRQKDFPKWLGLVCVAAAAVLSSIAWYYYYPLVALGILMAFALADMVLFAVMGDVLVCYRCGARHRVANVEAHEGYSHELGERYRQERLRLEADRHKAPAGGDNSLSASPGKSV